MAGQWKILSHLQLAFQPRTLGSLKAELCWYYQPDSFASGKLGMTCAKLNDCMQLQKKLWLCKKGTDSGLFWTLYFAFKTYELLPLVIYKISSGFPENQAWGFRKMILFCVLAKKIILAILYCICLMKLLTKIIYFLLVRIESVHGKMVRVLFRLAEIFLNFRKGRLHSVLHFLAYKWLAKKLMTCFDRLIFTILNNKLY